MPIREFKCPKCGNVIEALLREKLTEMPWVICLKHPEGHGVSMDLVEFSVPAKRNPRHGEG